METQKQITSKSIIFLVLILIFLYSCKEEYHDQEINIVVQSKLASCEDGNVHFYVLDVSDENFKELERAYILPICIDDVCKELMYSTGHFDTLKYFKLKGNVSIQGHDNVEYGCVGSKLFKVSEVERVLE